MRLAARGACAWHCDGRRARAICRTAGRLVASARPVVRVVLRVAVAVIGARSSCSWRCSRALHRREAPPASLVVKAAREQRRRQATLRRRRWKVVQA